jgi:predicted RNase H-like nuclease (RuvC/YqgF family)
MSHNSDANNAPLWHVLFPAPQQNLEEQEPQEVVASNDVPMEISTEEQSVNSTLDPRMCSEFRRLEAKVRSLKRKVRVLREEKRLLDQYWTAEVRECYEAERQVEVLTKRLQEKQQKLDAIEALLRQ